MKKAHLDLMVIMPILLFGVTSITYASGEVAWENPIQIAGPANLNYPNLVVDSKGQVHLFWGQGDLDSKLTNAIYYSKIGEKEYFMGTDILVTPNSNTASTPVVTLSPDNFIHVVWIGDRSLWHSKAPIELADKVRSWSTPNRIDGPTVPSTTARLISSPDGTLHLTYILFFGDKSSIIYMKSVDGGQSWIGRQQIPLTSNPEEGPVQIDMCIDSENRNHLVWQDGELASGGWPGHGVYYSGQYETLDIWTAPLKFDTIDSGLYDNYGPFMPSIFCGRDIIHIVWDGSPQGQRHHMYSLDGGMNWTNLGRISDFRGITYHNALGEDSAGVLHMASGSLDNRLMYMAWNGDDWSLPYPVDINAKGPHYPRMVIDKDDNIHVVWIEVQKNEIWYRRGRIAQNPENKAQPPVTQTTAPTETKPEELSTMWVPEITQTLEETPNNLLLENSSPELLNKSLEYSSTNLSTPILFGVLPVFLFVILFGICRKYLRHR